MTESAALLWWLVRRGSGMLRLGGMGGIVGLDWPAVLTAAAAVGLPGAVVVDLLPAIEAGMAEARHG